MKKNRRDNKDYYKSISEEKSRKIKIIYLKIEFNFYWILLERQIKLT